MSEDPDRSRDVLLAWAPAMSISSLSMYWMGSLLEFPSHIFLDFWLKRAFFWYNICHFTLDRRDFPLFLLVLSLKVSLACMQADCLVMVVVLVVIES